MDWVESAEAIGEVDELLASVGLGHGRRKTLAGTWEGGERRSKIAAKPACGNERSDGRAKAGGAGGGLGEVWRGCGMGSAAGREGCRRSMGKGSLNLGWTKEDDAANVVENRRRFLRAVAGVQAWESW